MVRKTVEHGAWKAYSGLAYIYYDDGPCQDYKKALTYFDKAYDYSKDSDIALIIGIMYEEGIGTKSNHMIANSYYEYAIINSDDRLKMDKVKIYTVPLYELINSENYKKYIIMPRQSCGYIICLTIR